MHLRIEPEVIVVAVKEAAVRHTHTSSPVTQGIYSPVWRDSSSL